MPVSAAARSCDVLVIGGGPAGSTAAALLAEKGWEVVLLEKDRHPRFHIGESLLPLNLPLFDRLGVREEIEAIAHDEVRRRAVLAAPRLEADLPVLPTRSTSR